MLSLIWRASARAELRSIISHVSERNGPAANRLLAAIETCTERLAAFPYMYRQGRISGTREAVVHPNYIVVYKVGADMVEIVSIIHSRRQYPPADDRSA